MELFEVDNIIEKVFPKNINLKSFEIKNTLCPKIWDKNNVLKDNVKEKLIEIAK